MGPEACPETSVMNHHFTLRNIPGVADLRVPLIQVLKPYRSNGSIDLIILVSAVDGGET